LPIHHAGEHRGRRRQIAGLAHRLELVARRPELALGLLELAGDQLGQPGIHRELGEAEAKAELFERFATAPVTAPRLVEPAAHRLEHGEHGVHDRNDRWLGLRPRPKLVTAGEARFDGPWADQRHARHRGQNPRDFAPLLRAFRVAERPFQHLLHRGAPQPQPVRFGHEPPRAREAEEVAACLEERRSPLGHFEYLCRLDLRIDLHAQHRSLDQHAKPQRLVRGRLGRRRRPRERGVGAYRIPRLAQRRTEVEEDVRVRDAGRVQQRRGPLEQVDGCRHIASGQGPPTRSTEAFARGDGQRVRHVVVAAELRSERMSPLEVKADDLLQLGPPLRVADLHDPGEPLVQVRAHLLRHAVVRRVADECVAETEAVVAAGRRGVRADQLLADERQQ
jgi:hypothetical protein